MRKNVWIALIATATVTGCGAFKTKNHGQKAQETDNALSGVWNGTCTKADWLGISHQKAQLTFGALGDFDQTTTLYSDAGCTQPVAALTEHGTYASLGASKTAQNANDINFTTTAYSVTPKSDDAVKLMNGASYCGVNNWANGQATDVLGKTCLGQTYANGDVTFDVYHVDNNQLTLGKSSLFLTKSSASTRPSQLDSSNVFTKQ